MITILGNPLTVMTLLPILGAILLMLAHWMANQEMRPTLEKPIRAVNLTIALLIRTCMGRISVPKLPAW